MLSSATTVITRLLLSVAACVMLSACATTSPEVHDWGRVHDGMQMNIYTGDDHI